MEVPAERVGVPLPTPLTRFFGRQEEIAWLTDALRPEIGSDGRAVPRTRLISLTGLGGAGKTRLAQEVAASSQSAYGGSVWFVPLADLSDPRLIPGAICTALGVPQHDGNMTPLLQAAQVLEKRSPALLVLDNYEHLSDGEGVAPVRELLQRVPTLACLVTSRQRLELGGQRELALLPLPTPVAPAPPEHLLSFPSVQLFVDRAQNARRNFQLTAENAPAVAALCERLEGIPLALDLVAAWASVLTPSQMLTRLGGGADEAGPATAGSRLLVSRERDVNARHQSLRAALDGSYDNLSPELQGFFLRLSVFRGGWILPSAVAIWSDDSEDQADLDDLTVLDDLMQLQSRSLIMGNEEHGEDAIRFRMLETVRQYAAEQMTPEQAANIARRHAAHFMQLAEEAEPLVVGPEQRAWLARLESEHDNLRAAIAWSLDNDITNALRILGPLLTFYRVRGHMTEGRRWLELAVNRSDASIPPNFRAKAHSSHGVLSLLLGEYETANASLLQALKLRRQINDTHGAANTLVNLGVTAREQGAYAEASQMFEEALVIYRQIGDQPRIAHSLNVLGLVTMDKGDLDTARAYLEECLALRQEQGNQQGIATTLNYLAVLARTQGDYATARLRYQQSLDIARLLEEPAGIGVGLNGLGISACRAGRPEEARPLLQESLRLFRDLGTKRDMPYLLESFAELALAEAHPTRTAILLGAAEAVRQALASPLPPNFQPDVQRVRDAAEAALKDEVEAFPSSWARGAAMTLDQAVAFALEEA